MDDILGGIGLFVIFGYWIYHKRYEFLPKDKRDKFLEERERKRFYKELNEKEKRERERKSRKQKLFEKLIENDPELNAIDYRIKEINKKYEKDDDPEWIERKRKLGI